MLKAVMDHMGSTNKRLREIFTTQPKEEKDFKTEDLRTVPKSERDAKKKSWEKAFEQNKKDYEVRKRFEEEIERRLEEGMTRCLKNYRIYAAVDTAMDSTPINKTTLPLMLYAQGKINVNDCAQQLNDCGCSDQYVRREEGTGKVLGIDMPRFVDMSVNLVKSVVTRRKAAQTNKYSNLWPYYNTEPRGVDPVSKLRADAASMTMDILVDDFGDREHNEQCIGYGFTYGRCVDFKRTAWEAEYQTRFIGRDTKQTESYVSRQGISFFNPHPTRFYYDSAHPISSINTDNGCEWLGYWDICRLGDLMDDDGYFNTKDISSTTTPWMLYWENLNYFNFYYDRVVPPRPCASITNTTSLHNDRVLSFGLDNADDSDVSVYVTRYYRKLVPKKYGIGEYPNPVWAKFTATADGTVIHAEFLYSRPAAYLGIDEDDNRLVSPSTAMLLLGFQDELTNLCTQMLLLAQLESMGIFLINIDAFQATPEGEEMVDSIRQRLKGQNWSGAPHVVEFSLSKMADTMMGAEALKQAVIDIKQASTSTSIESIFKAMQQLLNLMDRMLSMSPAEIGQPAPREISATEVVAINNTTSSVYDAISNNIDSFRAAKKRIFWESIVNCWKGPLKIPLEHRYSRDVIKKAGFEVSGSDGIMVNGRDRTMVTGHIKHLIPEYPYIFSSRDGAERPSNTAAASALAQALQYIIQVPEALQAMGKEKLFEYLNEISRLAGASVAIDLEPGDDNKFQAQELEQIKAILAQIEQALPAVQQVLNDHEQKLAEQEQVNADQEQTLKGAAELAQLVLQLQQTVLKMEQNQKIKPPEIPYQHAPPSVKQQIEAANGFQPATTSEESIKEGEPLPPP